MGEETFNVLIVHRLGAVRRFAALALRLHGLDPSQASEGQEALAIVRRGTVRLVLAEDALPDMSGADLAAAVAAIDGAPPVVLSSAYGRPPAGAEAAFLAEPFTLDELIDTVRRFVPLPADHPARAAALFPLPEHSRRPPTAGRAAQLCPVPAPPGGPRERGR